MKFRIRLKPFGEFDVYDACDGKSVTLPLVFENQDRTAYRTLVMTFSVVKIVRDVKLCELSDLSLMPWVDYPKE